jgi:hypothetical protein
MDAVVLLLSPVLLTSLQGQEPDALNALKQMLGAGVEIGTLLLTFTLAIFVVLVFGVRLLMVVRKLPVPTDPLDMARPRAFRALMVVAAAVLAPLAAWDFLPVEGLHLGWGLVWAYVFELFLATILWVTLHLFYGARGGG